MLEINPRKQKDPRNIYISLYTKNLLNKLLEQSDISQQKFDSFLEAVRCFYYDTFVYAKEKLPLTDDVLKHSFFVDFTKRATAAIENVFFFVEKFKLNFSASQLNELDNQFLQYQLLQDKDIPQSVWDEATIVDVGDNTKYYRMDVLWGHISKIKTCFGHLQFNLLFKVAKLVLVLPHSNAGEERVFSMVRNNKTTFRSSLGFNTLGSILIAKLSNEDALHFKPDKELLKSAKSATWEYNKRHNTLTSTTPLQ